MKSSLVFVRGADFCYHAFFTKKNTMPDYKKMYANLFNAVTDAIEILKQAQIETENIYIDSSEQEGKNILKLKVINTEDNNNSED